MEERIDNYYAVIMAGGGGTRLWPLSRRSQPKQMLQLSGDRTLFQMAIDRLIGLFSAERVLVVTVADQAVKLQRICPQIPSQNYILEPMPRGTASVVGLAAIYLHKQDPTASMAVLTADHFIENVHYFRSLLQSAYELAQQDYLVTLGIHPTFPSTGYGYIHRGEKIGDFSGNPAHKVLRFKEKPTEGVASDFIKSGDHDWNSGMFIWKVDRILDEFQLQMPALSSQLDIITSALGTENEGVVIDRIWKKIEPQTIDYGIMENASNVAVLPAIDLQWNDVGSWESLFDVLPGDQNGNVILNAKHIGIDTNGSIICSEQADRLITTIGLENLIIVDTGVSLLVCNREDSQKVRQLVNLLRDTDEGNYL
jgi:mannose-1-phosphate guanylyltransferase